MWSLSLYPAYSRGEKAQYVQDKLLEEADTIRNLLKNPSTTIYVCGSPEMEFQIREKLIKIIATDIVHSCMTLTRMKTQGRYIAEVYGNSSTSADSPIGDLWKSCLAQTAHIASSLDRVGVPKARMSHTKSRQSIRSMLLRDATPSSNRKTSFMPVLTKARSVWGAMMQVGQDYESSDEERSSQSSMCCIEEEN